MNENEAAATRFNGNPRTAGEIKTALHGARCPVCSSDLLIGVYRPPIPDCKAHCNHCGTELPIFVLLNQKAWRILANAARRWDKQQRKRKEDAE